jgi:biopolymer transport protein ExbB
LFFDAATWTPEQCRILLWSLQNDYGGYISPALYQNYRLAILKAMEQIGEEENLKLEQRLSLISLVGTISPMVGLLGTVDGMVQSFQVIALSNATPKPSELAQGVSMALITTLVGLWLAIPAIISFNLLKNQLSRMTLDVGVTAEQLMGRFEAPARSSPP